MGAWLLGLVVADTYRARCTGEHLVCLDGRRGVRDAAHVVGTERTGVGEARPRWHVMALAALVGVAGLSGCAELDDESTEVATDSADRSVPDEGRRDGAPSTTDANTVIVVTLPLSTEPSGTAAAGGPPAIAVHALAVLDSVPIAEPDPTRPPYIRDEYQPGGWPDLDGDCISTRHQVLAEQSSVPVTWSADGCFVETGEWTDPYSGEVLTEASEATIDHVIPLAEGHRAGAWAWDVDTKIRFTNDLAPGALVVVSSDSNQSKADQTPDRWMPDLESAHCGYAINWIDKKARWGLTMTQAEHDTVRFVAASCTAETAPDAVFTERATIGTTVPTTTTTTMILPSVGPAELVLVSCDARAEEVVIANRGGEPADLSGYTLHDVENRHSTSLGQWGSLAPGASLTIVTGPDATDGPDRAVWKRQNVWNNDGDTAHLVGDGGGTQTTRC